MSGVHEMFPFWFTESTVDFPAIRVKLPGFYCSSTEKRISVLTFLFSFINNYNAMVNSKSCVGRHLFASKLPES